MRSADAVVVGGRAGAHARTGVAVRLGAPWRWAGPT